MSAVVEGVRPSGDRSAEVLIRLERLRHRYGSKGPWAVDGLSGTVRTGRILGLVGPNGSGKTTLFRLILGLMRPTEGRIEIGGLTPSTYRRVRGIGYLPERIDLPADVQVREFARYVAALRGLTAPEAREAIGILLATVEMEDRATAAIGTLSHGYRQRVGLVAALLGDPPLLLLDEPANGLDPISVAVLRSVLRRLKRRGRTVIASSHNLAELQRVCDEVIVMRDGHALARRSRRQLASRPPVWVVRVWTRETEKSEPPPRPPVRGGVRLAADELAFRREDEARACARAATADGLGARIEMRPYDLELLFHALLDRADQGKDDS